MEGTDKSTDPWRPKPTAYIKPIAISSPPIEVLFSLCHPSYTDKILLLPGLGSK